MIIYLGGSNFKDHEFLKKGLVHRLFTYYYMSVDKRGWSGRWYNFQQFVKKIREGK